MAHILVRGGGFVNKGAEAMVYTVRQELGARIPRSRFFLELPSQVASSHTPNQFHPLPQPVGGRVRKGIRLVRASLACPELLRSAVRNSWTALQAIAQVDGVDAIVDVSGYSYADPWGVWPSRHTWGYLSYAARKGKPYVFLPQAWGPFSHREIGRLVRRFCRRSPLVYARDRRSLGYLNELGPQVANKVYLAPDIAFRFRAAPEREGAAVLTKLGLPTDGRPLVAMAPNMRVYERMQGEGKDNRYVRMLVALARQGLRSGVAVLLLPHEIGDGRRSDDRFLCRLVAEQASEHETAVAMSGEYSAAHIKAVIARADLLVGSRFHSIVAALSSRVPAVVLGWSHKYVELMRAVGMEEYVLGHEACDVEALQAQFDRAWSRRRDLRERLKQRVPESELKVDALFDRVAEALQGRGS